MRFIASTFIEEGELRLKLNGQTVIEGSGKISVEIGRGDHEVIWEVKGKIGTSFTVSISSPSQVTYHISRIITEVDKERQLICFNI